MAMNHKSNSLSLRFVVSEGDANITVFRKYSFILSLNQAISANTECAVMNGDTAVVVSTEHDNSTNTIRCVVGSIALEGVKLNKYVTIQLSKLALASNYYKGIKVSLATANTNGVLLASNPSLNSFAQYDDYLTNSSPYVKIIGSSVLNSAPPAIVTCTSPCSSLYPYNAFSITLNLEVTKYVKIEEFLLMFKINGLGLETEVVPTITSTDFETSTEDQNPLLTKLSGTLTLKKYMDYFVVDGIAPTNTLTGKVETPNFNVGRKFKLTISGFTTNEVKVTSNALTSIETYLRWKNAASILSYQTYDISMSTIVKILPITTAAPDQTSIITSVELMEGNSYIDNIIFEKSSWRFLYQITIPAMPIAGVLKVTSLNSGDTSFRFQTATCEHTNTDLNTFGTRKLCIPTPEVDANDETDSAFSIALDSSSSNQVVSFNIWGMLLNCGDDLSNSLHDLKFKYEYTLTGDNKVAEAATFSSQVKCQNSSEPTSDDYNQEGSDVGDKVYDHDNDGTLEQKDLVLYGEANDFNFIYVSDFSAAIDYTKITSEDNRKYLSEYGSSTANNQFVLRQEIKKDEFIQIRTPSWVTGGTRRNLATLEHTYQKGNVEFILDSRYTTYVTGDCTFNTYTEMDSTITTYSFDNLTATATANKLTQVNNYKIKTPMVNNYVDGGDIEQQYLTGKDGDWDDNKNFSFHASCYKIKDYSDVDITSLYQGMNFFFTFKRSGGPIVYNRIFRFFKFFNGGLRGFRKDSQKQMDQGEQAILYGSSDTYASTKLCILEIATTLLNEIEAGANTLYISLFNMALLNVGHEGSDVYPTANVSSAKAYPLYNDPFVYFGTKPDRVDYYQYSSINPMGPQIVVSGITSSTDKALYLPIICPLITASIPQRIIFQSVQTSGSKFINNNNLVFNKDGNFLVTGSY